MEMPSKEDLKAFRKILESAPPSPDRDTALARVEATERVLNDDGVSSANKAEDSPKDVENTERLMRYWAHGEGSAKIDWGVPGDFDRCRVELGKYVGPDKLDGLCANLHHRATGAWPGHAPGEEK